VACCALYKILPKKYSLQLGSNVDAIWRSSLTTEIGSLLNQTSSSSLPSCSLLNVVYFLLQRIVINYCIRHELDSTSSCWAAIAIHVEDRVLFEMCKKGLNVNPISYSLSTVTVISWSEFVATDTEARVRFPALPDFLRVEGLERGPLSLESTIKELLWRNSSDFGLENREYGRGDPSRLPRNTSICKRFHQHCRQTAVALSV
jgi:hypothetical protein